MAKLCIICAPDPGGFVYLRWTSFVSAFFFALADHHLENVYLVAFEQKALQTIIFSIDEWVYAMPTMFVFQTKSLNEHGGPLISFPQRLRKFDFPAAPLLVSNNFA